MKNEMRPKDRGLYVNSISNNRNEELADEWLKFALKADNERELVDFVRFCRPGFSLPKKIYNPIRGSYNINWRLEFEDGFSVMIRVPIPHLVAFPDEKIRAEVAAMKLIRANTTIPVPEIYGWGLTEKNPTGCGPFIIMEYIEHTQCLEYIISDELQTVTEGSSKTSHSDGKLLRAYRQMAKIMLQMSTIEGSAIGFPSVPRDRKQKPAGASSAAKAAASSQYRYGHSSHLQISRVRRRPLSQSTSHMVMSGLPPSILPRPDETYKTSHDYYQAMADLHLAHLAFHHNDAVTSPPDGREKYVARQLFRKLAREGRLTESVEHKGDATTPGQREEVFKLWCDDMRPASVLLDDNSDVVGVVDWEMSYFAPASFHDNPPWWLIISKPEFHKTGLKSWVKSYERVLPVFLEAVNLEENALREAKEMTEADGGVSSSHPQLLAIDEEAPKGSRPSKSMSERMKRNWDDGRFFIDYSARRNYGFDPVYWKHVDKKFFGKSKKGGILPRRSNYKGRLHLLSEKERAQMEPFVAWQLEDRKEEKVVEWDDKDAEIVFEACLAGTLGEIDIPKPRQIPWKMTDRPETPDNLSGALRQMVLAEQDV